MADDRKRRWYVAEDGTRMARPCPNCHHTKCGPNCTCDCDARFGEEDADAEMARLRARVAELEAAQQWRPMSEAPRDGTQVLLTYGGGDMCVAYYRDAAWDDGGDLGPVEDCDTTAWLPLPAAPKEVEL